MTELHVQQINIVCALRHELSEYSRRLALIHEQLDFLSGWLRGEAQLHSLTASAGNSQIHANSLLGGRLSAVLAALASDRVPPEWSDSANAEDKSTAEDSVDDWLQSQAQSCSFFEIWLSLIVFWQLNQTVWPGLSIAGATHSQLHLISLPLPSVFYLPAFRNPLRLLRCFSSPSSATLTFDVSVDSSAPAAATPQQAQAQPTGQPEPPSAGKAARLSVMELINLAFVRSIPSTASAQMPSVTATRGLSVFGLRLAGLSGTGLCFSEGRILRSSDAGDTGAVPGARSDGTCPDPLPPLRLDVSVDASKEKATSAEGQAVSTSTIQFSCPLLRSHSSQQLASLWIPIASNSPALAAIHVLC